MLPHREIFSVDEIPRLLSEKGLGISMNEVQESARSLGHDLSTRKDVSRQQLMTILTLAQRMEKGNAEISLLFLKNSIPFTVQEYLGICSQCNVADREARCPLFLEKIILSAKKHQDKPLNEIVTAIADPSPALRKRARKSNL